jgi:hypothetical protein
MILPNIVFSLGTPVSSTNKTDRLNIAEILLKVTLKTINQTLILHNIVFSRVRAQVTEGYASYVGLWSCSAICTFVSIVTLLC